MKVVEKNFRQLLQKVLCLWRKQIFVYIDEDFEINGIRPNFLRLLLTGILLKIIKGPILSIITLMHFV